MSQSKSVKKMILEKIGDLPVQKLQEVLNFVDFLKAREEEGDDPILKVVGCLSGDPLTAKEIEEELYWKEPA